MKTLFKNFFTNTTQKENKIVIIWSGSHKMLCMRRIRKNRTAAGNFFLRSEYLLSEHLTLSM